MNAHRDDDRPSWHEKRILRNFRYVGDLTPETESWWDEFGRKLKEAQKSWDGNA